MAKRTRKRPEGLSYIAEPGSLQLDDRGLLTPQAVTQLYSLLIQIIRQLNGRLTMGNGEQSSWTGNFDGQWVTAATPSVADTQFEVPHGLDRVPIGIRSCLLDKAAILYSDSVGSWNKERITLKCNVASVTALFEVF